MFAMTAIAEGFTIRRVEDERKQFLDVTDVVRLRGFVTAAVTCVVSKFENLLRPLLHVSVGVKNSGDRIHSALPVRGLLSDKVLGNPFAFARTRAEEVLGLTLDSPVRNLFNGSALGASKAVAFHLPAAQRGMETTPAAIAIGLALPVGGARRLEYFLTSGTRNFRDSVGSHADSSLVEVYHTTTAKGTF